MKVYRELQDILNASLPDEVLQTFKECLGQKVYYAFEDNCCARRLVGLAYIEDTPYYLVAKDDQEFAINIWTRLKKL